MGREGGFIYSRNNESFKEHICSGNLVQEDGVGGGGGGGGGGGLFKEHLGGGNLVAQEAQLLVDSRQVDRCCPRLRWRYRV